MTLAKRGHTLVKEIMPDVNARYQELEMALGMELMCSLFSVLDRFVNEEFEARPQLIAALS